MTYEPIRKAVECFDSGFIGVPYDELKDLLADLDRANAEVQEQARLNGMGSEHEAALLALVERVTRERDEALKDARRYRMVRRGQHWSVINGIGDTLRGEELDAAIDAALGDVGV